VLAIIMAIGGILPAGVSHASSPDPERVYALVEAIELGYIRVEADGLGTYRQVEYTVANLTSQRLTVRLDAGTCFRNPDATRQNLVTLSDAGERTLAALGACTVTVPSACTNAERAVPGRHQNWSTLQAPLGLDHAIRFYGKHQKAIDGWLAKKNPELFGTAEGRQVFLQLVIWAYLDAQYDDILRMLAGTVFHEDLAKAEVFIKECYESAKEVAQLIKKRDTRAMADWARRAIAENVDVDAIRERGRGLWRGVRDRINR
jgi:hypothetical protein